MPLTEPYSALGYSYTGNPSLTAVPSLHDHRALGHRGLGGGGAALRAEPCHGGLFNAALIKKDGRIHDKNFYDQITGTLDENLNFPVSAGSYYVAVRHRDHLAIMTATAIPLDAEPEMLVSLGHGGLRKQCARERERRLGHVVR